jgi:hypothetical protein
MSTTVTRPADVVRSVYEAFERRDVPAVLELFDPEIVITQSEEVPWGGTHRGHQGALEFFGRLGACIETNVEIDRLIVAGDAVVEIGRTRGHAVGSERPFEIHEAHVWRVRDGRVVGMDAYVDNAKMLEALA